MAAGWSVLDRGGNATNLIPPYLESRLKRVGNVPQSRDAQSRAEYITQRRSGAINDCQRLTMEMCLVLILCASTKSQNDATVPQSIYSN